jgi:hypothetical protein
MSNHTAFTPGKLSNMTLLKASAKIHHCTRRHFPFNVPTSGLSSGVEFLQPITSWLAKMAPQIDLYRSWRRNGRLRWRQDVTHDETLEPARQLARRWKFEWSQKTKRGFFLRAEDSQLLEAPDANQRELQELADGYEADFQQNPRMEGARRARGICWAMKAALTGRYGEDLNAIPRRKFY